KQSSANINLSGGTENIKYYAGLNYRRDGTVFNPDQFVRRIGGLFNLDVTSLNRKFNAQFALNYSNEQTDISATDFPSLFFAPPNYNPVNADGTYNWDLNFSNPFAALLTKYNAVNTLLNASMTLSYRPINGLVLKLLSSYTNSRS